MPSRRAATTLVLLGALVLLAAAAFLLEGPARRGRTRAEGKPLLADGDEEVTRLVIKGPAGQLVLRRSTQGWELERGGRFHTADEEAIGKILEMLTSRGPVVVSRQPSAHEGFQVDEKGATSLTVWAGERKALELMVGRQGPDLFSNYVRRGGEQEVLLVKGYYRGLLDRQPKSWLDLTVMPLAGREATGLDLRRPGAGDLSLRREEGGWRRLSPRPGTADARAVDELIGRLSSLRAADISEDGQTAAGAELLDVRVTLGNGRRLGLALRRGPEGSDRHLAVREGRDTPYLIGAYAVSDLEGFFDRLSGLGE